MARKLLDKLGLRFNNPGPKSSLKDSLKAEIPITKAAEDLIFVMLALKSSRPQLQREPLQGIADLIRLGIKGACDSRERTERSANGTSSAEKSDCTCHIIQDVMVSGLLSLVYTEISNANSNLH